MRAIILMARNTSLLFVRGKLLANPRDAALKIAAVGVVGAGVTVGLTEAGAPLLAVLPVVAFVGGFVTTLLLRDIKMA